MVNRVFETSLSGFCFDIRLSDLASPHYYLSETGRIYSTFIYIVSGNIDISSGTRSVTAHTGEFFCIPPRTRCRAVWTADDKPQDRILFYSMHLTENPAHSFSGDYTLMKFSGFSNAESLRRIESIFRLMQGGETDKMRALGKFIDFWCDLKPLLEFCPHPSLSKPLRDAVAILESEYQKDQSIAELANRVHISESRLYCLFRSELFQTPVAYRNGLRVAAAARMLESTDLSVSDIAERVGFSTLVHFREVFRASTGMTPNAFRKSGGSGM